MISNDGSLKPGSRAKLERKWGEAAWPAWQLMVSRLKERGFLGPLSLKEPGFLSFLSDPCESVRVIASVSRCGADALGHGLFDVVVTLWSKTIFDQTSISDPWYPVGAGYDHWHHGYVACMVARLSHLKWAESESSQNPAWTMTPQGVGDCVSDWDAHISPHLQGLHSDERLAGLLHCVTEYRAPKWVLSDPPGIRNANSLLSALKRS